MSLERYQTDPGHTFVTFEVKHALTSTVRGRFDEVQGSIELDAATHRGRADVTIDTGSISTGTPKFDAHLRSDAFFDAEHHRQARFVGTGFRYEGDKLAALDGELTLLGRTHPVTLRSTSFNCYHSAHLNQDVCGGDFEATILRSQWGMTWGREIGIPDSVKLLIEIEAIKQA